VGSAYSSSLVASGGIQPYTFSIVGGSLPPGLTLNAATGAITGTPTQAGAFSFTAMVSDSTAIPGDTARHIVGYLRQVEGVEQRVLTKQGQQALRKLCEVRIRQMVQEENCQNKIERFVTQRRSLPCAFQETDVGHVARLGGTIRFGDRGRGKIHAGDAGYVRGQEKLQIADAAADAEYSR
jgi:hypothetical protein